MIPAHSRIELAKIQLRQPRSVSVPSRLRPIRKERPPFFDEKYKNNAYPESFYRRLRKRGFEHEESQIMAPEMEDARAESFGPSKAIESYQVDSHQMNAIFRRYEEEGRKQALHDREADLGDIDRHQAELTAFEAEEVRARERPESRLQEERRAVPISIGDVYAENAFQHRMQNSRLDVVKAQHDLFPLLERTQKKASENLQENIFGKYLGDARPPNAGSAFGKVERIADGWVRNSQNHVYKSRFLRHTHEIPIEVLQIASATPRGIKVNNTGGLTRAELDAVVAHTRQKEILEVQHDIDRLWKHTQETNIQLPDWYMPTEHGMVNIRDLTNHKRIKNIIDNLPEQAQQERLKLESELHALEGKRTAMSIEVQNAELLRDRMAENNHVDAVDRRSEVEYMESHKRRSNSVQKGKEFRIKTKSNATGALNKSHLGKG